MDVVPITVFDKAKLKKELFEMVYQNPNLLLPKNKGISVMEISLQQLIDSCGIADDVKFQNEGYC